MGPWLSLPTRLNNYLSVVTGVTDLMGIVLTDYPDARIHTWLNGIQRSTRMMSQIVAALMKDALISGKPDIALEKVDLCTVVGNICNYYQVAASRKDIRIVWQPPPTSPCYVSTDSPAVAAVMDNLLSAIATEYSPRNAGHRLSERRRRFLCLLRVRPRARHQRRGSTAPLSARRNACRPCRPAMNRPTVTGWLSPRNSSA